MTEQLNLVGISVVVVVVVRKKGLQLFCLPYLVFEGNIE